MQLVMLRRHGRRAGCGTPWSSAIRAARLQNEIAPEKSSIRYENALTLQSLLFWQNPKNPRKKQGFSSSAEPLKSMEKRAKTHEQARKTAKQTSEENEKSKDWKVRVGWVGKTRKKSEKRSENVLAPLAPFKNMSPALLKKSFSGRKKAHKHKLFALVNIQMALGQGLVVPGLTGPKKFMRSPRNTGNVNFFPLVNRRVVPTFKKIMCSKFMCLFLALLSPPNVCTKSVFSTVCILGAL